MIDPEVTCPVCEQPGERRPGRDHAADVYWCNSAGCRVRSYTAPNLLTYATYGIPPVDGLDQAPSTAPRA